MTSLRTIVGDLTFPEGPRWRHGRLFFSDFHSHRVLATDLDGNWEQVAKVAQQPSGLGWDRSGNLLVVSMLDRKLLRQVPHGELEEFADLSSVAPRACNDMVVSTRGHAYVGNFGFDRRAGEEPKPTQLAHVLPSGEVRVGAQDLMFPNGMVITPDEKTLVVAETYANRLTAFDIRSDGSLTNRQTWADLGESVPDGICLDAEGAIWVADPRAKETFRVRRGGEVAQRVATGELGSYACALGGAQRTTLLICACVGSGQENAHLRGGKILATEVQVPGAGLP